MTGMTILDQIALVEDFTRQFMADMKNADSLAPGLEYLSRQLVST
mgnify:CR=1 FL=1